MSSTSTWMDSIAIDWFLRSLPVGVHAMARDDDGDAIPVSVVYPDDWSSLTSRLGYGPVGKKRALVEPAERATFVVFDRTEAGPKSAVAEGQLEPLSESPLDTSIGQASERLRIPCYQVHRRPTSELEFAILKLAGNHLGGVTEPRRGSRAGAP